MVDLVNQGKGGILKVWKTNNEKILLKIYNICAIKEENFFYPTESFREKILKELNLGEE